MRTSLSRLVPGAAVVLLLVGGTACSSTSKKAATATSAGGAATTAATADTGSSSSPATATAGTSPTTVVTSTAPATPRCVTSGLRVTLGQTGAAAGNRYLAVVFTNTGTAPCTLYGFPGVSLLDSSGAQIGQPATREPGHPTVVVTLAPNGSAAAAVHTAAAGVAPHCLPTSAKLRVYVPEERTPVDLVAALTDCGGIFSVFPVSAGTSGTS